MHIKFMGYLFKILLNANRRLTLSYIAHIIYVTCRICCSFFFEHTLSFAFVRFDRGDRMLEEGSALHANSISECVHGVSTQYAYTHMGYMEEEYLGCLRSIRMDME